MIQYPYPIGGIMLEILKAILFGIVEGITEWLPISSTGHMILLNEIMPLKVSDAFYSMFEVVIQLGAIMAVVILFWNKLWPFGKNNNKEPLSSEGAGAYIKCDIFKLWFHILVSCIPAAIVGVLFDEKLEELFYNYTTVAIMLILFGIAFIICGVFSVFACLDIAPCTELCGVYRAIGIIVWILVILWTLPPDTWLARFATNNYKRYEDNYD